MIALLKKPYRYAVIFSILLLLLTAFVLLDTFLISHAISSAGSSESIAVSAVQDTPSASPQAADAIETAAPVVSTVPQITSNSYTSDTVQIQLSQLRVCDSNVYVADVQLSDPSALYTVLADDSYGTNLTENTSSMASRTNAILAVNGDYYGAGSRGLVIKNGVLYRDSIRRNIGAVDLVLFSDGHMETVTEGTVDAQTLLAQGAVQSFAFGPVLVQNSTVAVEPDQGVSQFTSCNPRTAIGCVDALHYIFLVSDGRTSQSSGLSLYELAGFLADYGCQTAYNLDGGGSSVMVFNGSVVNQPTTNGKKIKERAVSDCVCIAG